MYSTQIYTIRDNYDKYITFDTRVGIILWHLTTVYDPCYVKDANE